MPKNLFKNEKGFTLLEVILSIATIAILSGFILQMFISAASANSIAQSIDIASVKSMDILETIKSFDSSDMLLKFSDEFDISQEDENLYYNFYDKDWNVIENVDENMLEKLKDDNVENISDEYCYLIKLKYNQNPEQLEQMEMKEYVFDDVRNVQVGSLFNINVEAFNLQLSENKTKLFDYKTSKYFLY